TDLACPLISQSSYQQANNHPSLHIWDEVLPARLADEATKEERGSMRTEWDSKKMEQDPTTGDVWSTDPIPFGLGDGSMSGSFLYMLMSWWRNAWAYLKGKRKESWRANRET